MINYDSTTGNFSLLPLKPLLEKASAEERRPVIREYAEKMSHYILENQIPFPSTETPEMELKKRFKKLSSLKYPAFITPRKRFTIRSRHPVWTVEKNALGHLRCELRKGTKVRFYKERPFLFSKDNTLVSLTEPFVKMPRLKAKIANRNPYELWTDKRYDRTRVSAIAYAIEGTLKKGIHDWTLTSKKLASYIEGQMQAAKHFQPYLLGTLLAYLQQKFPKFEDYKWKIVDPCSGWGDRLVSALALHKIVSHYAGIDPNTQLAEPYQKIKQFYDPDGTVITQLFTDCAETFDLAGLTFAPNLIFTSPPYFKCEIYSPEASQSTNKFPTLDQWKEGFFKPLVQRYFDLLENGGFYAIVLSDTKKAPDLTSYFNTLMSERADAQYVGCLGMGLHKRPVDKSTSPLPSAECIFIYRKVS